MTPGIHAISNEAYHSGPGVSRSALWTIYSKTPAHYKYGEPATSSAFDLGSAAHCALLEPDDLPALFTRGPDDRRGNRWKDAQAEAEHLGRTLLTSADYDAALRIRDAGERSSTLRTVRKGALIERSAYAIDPETGLLCRCRPDAVNPSLGIMLDLKTTTAGGRDEFARSTAKFGYHVQEAFYTDVWGSAWMSKLHHEGNVEEMHNGAPVVAGFVFVVIEKTAPYMVSCYELAPSAVDEGRAIYRQALETYAECTRTGVWPGYPEDPEPLDIPRWAYRLTSPNDRGETL